MIEFLISYLTSFISTIGYIGLFLLMAIESTMLPLPSELIMPFAGFLVANGAFSFTNALIFATLGSLAGSLTSFYLGKHLSPHFIRKFGKYFFLNEYHLDKSEKWFKKRGKTTIFISRFVPGIRHVISIPAGAANMDMVQFSIFTIIGAGIWNGILLYAGYILQKNWSVIYNYTKTIDIIIVIVVILAMAGYVWHLSRDENKEVKIWKK